MTLRFMTARDRYGNRRYLEIDTEQKTYNTVCRYMTPESDRVEVKVRDIRKLETRLDLDGYVEVMT